MENDVGGGERNHQSEASNGESARNSQSEVPIVGGERNSQSQAVDGLLDGNGGGRIDIGGQGDTDNECVGCHGDADHKEERNKAVSENGSSRGGRNKDVSENGSWWGGKNKDVSENGSWWGGWLRRADNGATIADNGATIADNGATIADYVFGRDNDDDDGRGEENQPVDEGWAKWDWLRTLKEDSMDIDKKRESVKLATLGDSERVNEKSDVGVDPGRGSLGGNQGDRRTESKASCAKEEKRGESLNPSERQLRRKDSEGLWKKTLKRFGFCYNAEANQNWNNSVHFEYDNFEYDDNEMPLLLVDEPNDNQSRFLRRRTTTGDGGPTCCWLFCKCLLIFWAFLLVGGVGGLVGYIVACVFAHQGTLSTEPFYQFIGHEFMKNST